MKQVVKSHLSCSSDSDNSIPENDDNQWVENWVDIPDFQFDSGYSGIKLDIPDHAKDVMD